MNRPLLVTIAFLASSPLLTFAGEKEDELIAKITEAYGGEAIVNLSSYQIQERYLSPSTGQGHSPTLDEIGQSSQVLKVDINNNKAVYDSWSEGRSGGSQYSTISDGEKAYNINYARKTYAEANSADPHVFAGGTMRTSDSILVYELNKAKAETKLSADQLYMNRPHHVITMPFPSSSDLKLYVDTSTLLVSKMVRENPQLGNLEYVYSAHKKNNGISYASGINFFIAGSANLISTQHELSFNVAIPASEFDLPTGFVAEGQRIDTSQMLVNKISERVYHIGQGNAYSMFVDTNVGVVGAGGYAGYQSRLEHFQKESENYKPLAYQVVTHHHSDHIGGLLDAVEAGAKLVTVSDNIATIKDAFSPTLNAHMFHSVGPRASFGDGRNRVEIYEVSTVHAASFLVTYVPADKTVFIADHMGSPFATGTPVASQSTVDMLAALEGLGIDIKTIVTAHSARVFSLQDMRKSVAAYKPTTCGGNRPVCN